MGYTTVELHDTPQALYGYQGDRRKETAEIIIRRKHIGGMPNDIGFAKQADGTYSAIISEYDRTRHNDAWLNRVKQNYAESRTMAIAKSKGYTLKSREVVNGQVKLQFQSR